MASPQLERGHTRIANDIMDALCASGLSGRDYQVLLLLIRMSYGWHRKHTTPIFPSDISNTTKVPLASVKHSLSRLLNFGIVSRDSRNQYSLNKNYEKWKLQSQPISQSEANPLASDSLRTLDDGEANPLAPGQSISLKPEANPLASRGQPISLPLSLESKTIKDTAKIVPPKREWVREYVKKMGYKIDPDHYFDRNTATGWMIGKHKMKDWQAAVRTWEHNRATDFGKKPKDQKPALTHEEIMRAETIATLKAQGRYNDKQP